MEELKNILQQLLRRDICAEVYSTDEFLQEYITIAFYHLKDVYNNGATLHFSVDEKGEQQFYFYFWHTPANKRNAATIKKLLYHIAKIQQPTQKATSYNDGICKRQKAAANKKAIIQLFDEHGEKCKQVYNIKYAFASEDGEQ